MSVHQHNNNFPMELIDISFVFAAILLLSHPDALAPIVFIRTLQSVQQKRGKHNCYRSMPW